MIRDFNAAEEARKHPGVTAGGLALIVLGAATVVYLTQRSGPTRYQRLRTRLHPRGWMAGADLSGRFHDAVDAFRHGAETLGARAGSMAHDAGHRAAEASDDVRGRAKGWLNTARSGSDKAMKKHRKQARKHIHQAGAYARDHAREGGALLAVAAIAAAIGAAALESRRPDSRVRRIARF